MQKTQAFQHMASPSPAAVALAAANLDLPSYLQYIFYENSRTNVWMIDGGIVFVVLWMVLSLMLELEAAMVYYHAPPEKPLPRIDKVASKIPASLNMLQPATSTTTMNAPYAKNHGSSSYAGGYGYNYRRVPSSSPSFSASHPLQNQPSSGTVVGML